MATTPPPSSVQIQFQQARNRVWAPVPALGDARYVGAQTSSFGCPGDGVIAGVRLRTDNTAINQISIYCMGTAGEIRSRAARACAWHAHIANVRSDLWHVAVDAGGGA